MVKQLRKKLFVLVSVGLLASCAAMQPEPKKMEPAFVPQQIQDTCYEQKTDNFLVLLDASGSMGDGYKGQSKFKTAEQVVSRMNQTIPGGMSLKAAVKTFGAGFGSDTQSTFGPGAYSKESLAASLGKATYGGFTPIGQAVSAGGDVKSSLSGNTAVILVSDGKQNVGTDAAKAAREVKDRYGDKLCFYTVLVGDDPAGKALMDEIARIGECGSATTAEAINSSGGMAGFVKSAFCSGEPPPAPAPVAAAVVDRDGDGVPDDRDKCPNTPKGATVNADGCWAYQGEVLFDVNSAAVKPAAFPILDEAATVLRKNPDLNVEIQGFADSTGPAEFNLVLSQKRADSVMGYLIDKGIDPGRLTARGYGEENPVASNDTPEGRAQNRRVEFGVSQ
ncbi:MAG: OmpA family protein [Desulfobacterales bacterium]|jgi:OmpA-OmpF porin, OOP family